ncbi:HAMP domain-containing histidine kinase [Erythrobacter sp. NFXS35]|uniref:histidine kinase dimerization/phospho-acceptor domain-containing protein n=1 Tax=Erythrobacter sp. NFXS35 TaxID=2818436 RepID=UPI0032DE4FB6
MFFDDRLATVLRLRATGEAGLRTQYRQLLDLLGKNRVHPTGRQYQSLIAAAWLRMDALADAIPAEDRARMIREAGWRFRSADLAAHLAEQEPEVAIAALSRADLSVGDWSSLIPRIPVRARGFLRLRRDLPLDVEALLARLGIQDRGLPAPEPTVETTPVQPVAVGQPEHSSVQHVQAAIPVQPVAARTRAADQRNAQRERDETGRSEISALVERIAQFRRERGASRIEADIAPRLPLGEMPDLPDRAIGSFGFATDARGKIVWASGDVAPMVIGTRLTSGREVEAAPMQADALTQFISRRQPIIGLPFVLGGAAAVAGDWTLDAQPAFSNEGHFTGYTGRFRRILAEPGDATARDHHEADRIRQLLHELRTPVTAVQGYAEVIQQQLFGPAPNEYRALAAAIAADAARILAGFDELDRLARLETGAATMEAGETDLVQLVHRILGQIAPILATRTAAVEFAPGTGISMLVPCDAEDLESLLWRLLASLGAACGEGEKLETRLDPLIGNGSALARLTCTLPADLAREENLFAASARPAETTINPGLFGAGFAFRLARAEARAAGGALAREGDQIVLTLPLLSGAEEVPSADRVDAGRAAG